MDAEQQFHFSQGIPGFEEYEDFRLRIDSESPLAQLISLSDDHVGFVLARPEIFFSEHVETLHIEIFKNEKSIPWNLDEKNQTLAWVIVAINRENVMWSTANLRAPILLNEASHEGIQLILDNEAFLSKQPLFAQLEQKEQEGGTTDAGTGKEAE